MAAFRSEVRRSRRERVSLMVDDWWAERARTRDSMAATGMVRSGSDSKRERYVFTTSKGGSVEGSVVVREGMIAVVVVVVVVVIVTAVVASVGCE